MKIKVRCQICGDMGIEDTKESGCYGGFHNHKLSDFVEVKQYLNFEIWLCYKCEDKFDFLKGYSGENYFEKLIRSLELSKDEVAEIEWEEMVAEGIIKETI